MLFFIATNIFRTFLKLIEHQFVHISISWMSESEFPYAAIRTIDWRAILLRKIRTTSLFGVKHLSNEWICNKSIPGAPEKSMTFAFQVEWFCIGFVMAPAMFGCRFMLSLERKREIIRCTPYVHALLAVFNHHLIASCLVDLYRQIMGTNWIFIGKFTISNRTTFVVYSV